MVAKGEGMKKGFNKGEYLKTEFNRLWQEILSQVSNLGFHTFA